MLKKAFFILLLLLLNNCWIQAQQIDSILKAADSVAIVLYPATDSASELNRKSGALSDLLKTHLFLNINAAPVSRIQIKKNYYSKDFLFYSMALVLLLLGILRATYSKYFTNLLRVFFNTSLRQSQLTDQLLQAKLPSLFFNIFFVLITGWYLFLLLIHFEKVKPNEWEILLVCVLFVSITYLIKYYTLKFAGWVTGQTPETEMYTFIVFLINKVIGLALVPLVIVIGFSGRSLANAAVILSFVVLSLLFVMRFLRSYGLLQNKLKVSSFQFLLYIIGVELLPLFLIYKSVIVIMAKRL